MCTEPELLVSYETVANSAEQAAHNRRWCVTIDGRVFTQRNQRGAIRPPGADVFWFDAPLTESHRLDPVAQGQLMSHLGALPWRPEHVPDPPADHGGRDRVRVRVGGGLCTIDLPASEEARMLALIRPVLSIIRKPGL
jgi:hypothetical protein